MVVLCHANVRSLVADGRKKEVEELVCHNGIDILCLTETWLKPKHLDSTLMIPGFQKPFRHDRISSRGGGVAVFVRDGLAVEKLSLSSVNIECIGLRVSLPKRKKVMLFTVYRPPQTAMESFLHDFELALYPYLKHTVWIVGDFNAKNSAWWNNQSTDPQGEALKLCSDSLNLHQIVTQPTYNVLSGKESLLDLMFTNAPHSVLSSYTLPPLADHCPVVAHLSAKKSHPPKAYKRKIFLYDKTDTRQLRDALEEVDWESIVQGSLDEAVLGWTDSFLATCHAHVPHKLTTINPSSKPWYNKHLKSLATWRDRLFRRSRGQPQDATVVSAFRKVRNLYVSELRAAEKRYFTRLGWKLSSGNLPAKVWWRHAKKACGWSSRTGIQTLSVDGQVVSSPVQQAATLNEKFIKQCSAFPASSDPVVAGANSVFAFQEVSEEEVFRELKALPSGKSPGLDGVSNDLLKLAACPAVAESLAKLFNMSLRTGVFPKPWKQAMITPILKSGKPSSDPQSYRPVALLSCLSKLLEKFVHKQLLSHLVAKNLIPDNQYGFLRGRSAEWQLLCCLEEWHSALDANYRVHAVFLDASKAFDRVHHGTLLSTIAGTGVQQSALDWFNSYLSGRTICTRVLDALSPAGTVTSGVPQGSVLGPLLFLLYFKDIPASTNAKSALFADDTMLYRTDCTGGELTPCCPLQSDLSALSVWADDHQVLFNGSKSAELHIGSRPRSAAEQPPLRLVESNIPCVSDHTHLGVSLASNLRWDDHMKSLDGKVAGYVHLCRILAFRYNMQGMAIRRFFLAFIRPRMEYCSAVWCGASSASLKHLEKVQLRVAKAIVKNPTLQDQSTLRQARLPTLSWRRREHCLGLLWQLANGKGPPTLSSVLVPCAQQRSTRFPHSFRFPSASSTRHLSSFLCRTIPVWNRLPTSVVSSKSLSAFRSSVRCHFASDMFSYGLS